MNGLRTNKQADSVSKKKTFVAKKVTEAPKELREEGFVEAEVARQRLHHYVDELKEKYNLLD